MSPTSTFDTSPAGLQRLYYRIVLSVVASVLVLQVLTQLALGDTVRLTPQRVALFLGILLFSWFGHELVRDPEESRKEPKGFLLGILGLLLVLLCVETGGLASAYYMLVVSTSIFGALVMKPMKAFLLTSILAAAYCLFTWLYPTSGGLVEGGLGHLIATIRQGARADSQQVSALVVHCGFLFVGTWIAVRLTSGFKEQVVRLETHATRDPLTGLPNRRGFMDKVQLEYDRAFQWDWPIAILVMDLDHFKRVNDRFGHPIGDEVLAEAAQLLREAAGPVDHLGRIGGEEFALAAVGADHSHGADLADRIVRTFRAHDWKKIRPSLEVTCSVGVAVLHPSRERDRIKDLAALIQKGDEALLQVKKHGRNGYLLAGEEPSAQGKQQHRGSSHGARKKKAATAQGASLPPRPPVQEDARS